MRTIQSLYEGKFTTYPRVDTQYLSDDIYAKCPQTLNGLFQTKFAGQAPYADLVRPLGGKKLAKSKRVFDSSKVTDHHAIIPTGVPPHGLSDAERNVFDLIARRFIAAFYPDCIISTTTVNGEVQGEEEKVEFKVSGKEILDPGWRVVFAKENKTESDSANASADNGKKRKMSAHCLISRRARADLTHRH